MYYMAKSKPLLKTFGIIAFLSLIILCFQLIESSDETFYLRKKPSIENLTNNQDVLRHGFIQNGLPLSEIEPRSDSFFFVETSGKDLMSFKEICSIESALKHHPNNQVYLVMTSSTAQWIPPISLLNKYANFHVRHINFEDFINSSPLRKLWTSGKISNSLYRVSHMSDIMRFLLMDRYGGTYLDTDQIILKPFPRNFSNFIGKESQWIAAGVLRFSRNHPIVKQFVKEMEQTFNGRKWGSNGPLLVSRVLKRFCKINPIENNHVNAKNCGGIEIFAKNAFYPIHGTQWSKVFDAKSSKFVLEKVKKSYSLHIWGKKSSKFPLDKAKGSAYLELAKVHCPVTFSTLKYGANMV